MSLIHISTIGLLRFVLQLSRVDTASYFHTMGRLSSGLCRHFLERRSPLVRTEM